MSLRLRSRSRDKRRRSPSREKRKPPLERPRRRRSGTRSSSAKRSPKKKSTGGFSGGGGGGGGGSGFDVKVMPEDLERVQALARQYNQNKSVAQAVALHLEQTKNQQPPNPEVETFLAQYPQIQAHAAARLRALPKEAQTNVLMRGGLGSARDPTAMLLGRIRQVDPFNTTWVPHTPGMQPFPAQGQMAVPQVPKIVPDKPPPPPDAKDKEKEPYEGEYENLTALAEGELLQYAGSKGANSGAKAGDSRKPVLSDWRRARPSPDAAAPPWPPAFPVAGASPAVSSQAVCCQEFSVFFLQSVCKFIQALGLPPPPMPNGAKFSPPGSNIQCFLSLLSLMFHLLEGLGVTAKSGPPLPQGRGKCLHLDCSNLKDARLITNFDGPPSNTDRTLNNPSQHVDTDESYTHMEGAPGLSGNLQTLPGPPEPPAPPAPSPAFSSTALPAAQASAAIPSALPPVPVEPVPMPSSQSSPSSLDSAAKPFTLTPELESKKSTVQSSLANLAASLLGKEAADLLGPKPESEQVAPAMSSPAGSAGAVSLDLNSAARVAEQAVFGAAPSSSSSLGANGAASASSTAVPAPPVPAVPMGMAHPSAPSVGASGSLPTKSALDAPLTEAQIATLPPALQAVLRKKQAEQGSTPALPTGPPGPPAPEPAPSATDDLTPEQRAVLAQIRQKQDEREKKEAEEKAQKQQAQQAVAAETAYQNFWVQRQMASLMSLYQQGHALQQERKTTPAPAPAGQSDFWEGDWKCAKCGDHQFARNQECRCRNCGAPRES
eukprot:symbB.v1.2.036090.t1/scaffold5018.1/size31776/2